MNDDRPDAEEPRFDDSAHAWVRDLLASTRDTGPVPDDVAARLDATLASLRAERVDERVAGAEGIPADDERGSDGGSAAVVPLRRRIAPFLAAAAAVLVVAGGAVGVTRLADGGGSSNSSASSAGAASAEQSDRGSGAVKAPADRPSGDATAARALPRLTRAAFAAGAAAVMRELSTAGAAADDLSGTTPAPTEASPPAVTGSTDQRAPESGAMAPPVTSTPGPQAMLAPVAAACPGPAVAGSVTVPATLDGAPVALVFRPPTATAQRVEAWSCDGVTLLASATVGH